MFRRGIGFPPELTVAPKDYHAVSVPQPSNYRVPEGFMRVRSKTCASDECRSVVQFVHKTTKLCLACATKRKLLLEWNEPDGMRGSVPAVTDDQIAERIELARQIRQWSDPRETILPQLEGAMDGPTKNARRNYRKLENVS